FEHVRSERGWLARLQRWANPAWGAVADGCHLDRDPLSALRSGGFSGVRVEARMGRGMLPLVLVRARAPGAVAD
ncbi:MAG: SAM-dependent methyltransferase, partial [Dehalococcoidia bacterium]|nr:SAM-dependent methyltransferase [Dehalococcoidia bacterium]